MADRIKISGSFIVIFDDGTGDEFIRHPRANTTYLSNGSDNLTFYDIAPVLNGTGQRFILAPSHGSINSGTVLDDRTGSTFASVGALKDFLDSQIGFFLPVDYQTELSLLNIPNRIPLNRDGSSVDLGTSVLDVWGSNADLVYETTATAWEILSDNAADTAAGTGMRTVTVTTLDGNFNLKTEIITMNGTTPVTLNGTHLHPDLLRGLTAGSGRVNAGLITLRTVGTTNPQAFMRIGESESKNSHITVPAGKVLHLKSPLLFVGKGDDIIYTIVVFDAGITDQIEIKESFGRIFESSTGLPVVTPRSFPEKTALRITGVSSNPTPILAGVIMQYTLIDV